MNKYPIVKIDPNWFDEEKLKPAASTLQKGGVIAYPTETVYGLGADIYFEEAVDRIFRLKKRDPHKPFSVMISSIADVEELCREVPEYGKLLIDTFWPGPLTLIFKASDKAPKYIKSKDNKIGLRLPDHPITKVLMRMHRQPLTSTSANLTGAQEAVTAQHVVKNFGNAIDLIIDGGPSTLKIPSTVLDATGVKPKIIREGAITHSHIKETLVGVNI